ncbi:MAG: enoyl-CoA hydratase/isomerase family protein [Candidatus Eremiobacteraeota bacterium]|nr:enoyl-CoA hydratase/isomerase family protein [Candidatus Eremiobacteraeota bacterium]
MALSHVVVRREGPVAYVALDRPEVHNAFNSALIGELHHVFDELAADDAARVVVLSGNGKSFCGGADVHWMRGSLDLGHDENVNDARRMSRMFRAIDRLPKPVIGRVHGAALGGGSGLAAVCDVVIAEERAMFGFTEVKLGIIPAVISPFVIAKIGLGHARALALTGERFGARRALAIGLVHEVLAENELDGAVARAVSELLSAGPSAIAAAKRLLAAVAETPYDDTLDLTARAIAAQRTSAEGQEGLRAFLDKRKAGWMHG